MRRSLAIAGIAIAIAFGVLIGTGRAGIALLLMGVVAYALLLDRAPAELLSLAPFVVAMIAPWQRIEPFRSNVVLYPVLLVTLVTLAVLLLRGSIQPRLGAPQALGLFVAGWAVLGLALGHGTTILALRWVLLWLIGYGVYQLVDNERVRGLLVSWAWLPSGLLGGYALVEWVFKRNPVFGPIVPVYIESNLLDAYRFRPAATLGHPLVVADLLGLLLVLCVVALQRKAAPRGLVALGLAAGMAGLLVTGARGVMLVTAVAVVAALVVAWRPTLRETATTMSVAGLGAAAVALAYPLLAARFEGAFASGSFGQRLLSLSAAAEVVRTSPLFGVGAGGASLAMLGQGFVNITAETEYAGLLMGVGIPGLVAVLAMPVVAVIALMRSSEGEDRARWPLAIAVAVYALGVIGTHNYFDWWFGAGVFWACVALASPRRSQATA